MTATIEVYTLVSEATQRQIGARLQQHPNPDRVTKRAQWIVRRPPFVADEGRCYLVVQRSDADTFSIFVGRQGMCADVYTEAEVLNVEEEQVDSVVSQLWRARSLAEVSNAR